MSNPDMCNPITIRTWLSTDRDDHDIDDDRHQYSFNLSKIMVVCVSVMVVSINVYSSKLAGKIQIIFTVAKLLALFIIIIGGIVKLFQGTHV